MDLEEKVSPVTKESLVKEPSPVKEVPVKMEKVAPTCIKVDDTVENQALMMASR